MFVLIIFGVIALGFLISPKLGMILLKLCGILGAIFLLIIGFLILSDL